MNDWQPIETAPKDGTFVLLGGGTFGDDWEQAAPRVMIGRWLFCQWVVAALEGGFSVAEYQSPTHWKPSPAGPR